MSRIQYNGQLNASDINVELRRPWNSPFSLYDELTRQLIGYGGGPISFHQFYGRQLYPDRGIPVGRYCSNYHLFENYTDGNGGTYSNVIEWNSPSCGYVPPPPPPPVNNFPPAGTILAQYCTNFGSLFQEVANGNGNSYTQEIPNHPSCTFGWGEQG